MKIIKKNNLYCNIKKKIIQFIKIVDPLDIFLELSSKLSPNLLKVFLI